MGSRLIPFGWVGSKVGMLPYILPLFPAHHVYVDVFGGSGAVLLNKQPAVIEVYNDLDEGLITFFEVIRDPQTYQQFVEKAQWLLSSRTLWTRFRDTWQDQPDPVEKALRWWYVASTSYAGRWGAGWAVVGPRTDKTKNHNLRLFRSRLKAVHERFRDVNVENKDFRDLIPIYDSPKTFFYCDPPYDMQARASDNAVYRHESDETLHEDLVKLLLDIEGMAMLSGYETPIYQPLLDAGWQIKRFTRRAASVGKTRALRAKRQGDFSDKRVECVYISPRTVIEHDLFGPPLPQFTETD